jgi:hypothetical protein
LDSDEGHQAILNKTMYILPLLAIGAVHHLLIGEGLRMETDIVMEMGSAWSTHHFACLVGYSVNAVPPYLANSREGGKDLLLLGEVSKRTKDGPTKLGSG